MERIMNIYTKLAFVTSLFVLAAAPSAFAQRAVQDDGISYPRVSSEPVERHACCDGGGN
jgi:hypothetical protein